VDGRPRPPGERRARGRRRAHRRSAAAGAVELAGRNRAGRAKDPAGRLPRRMD
jgi:hypothetical protein